MASISKDRNGNRTIQFVGGDGKRRSIRLGKVSQRIAEMVKFRVEALNTAILSKSPPDGDTAAWVRDIGTELANKLAAVGLISARVSSQLGEFLTAYIASRTDVKPSSRVCMEQARRRLLEYVPAETHLRDVTPADADGFFRHLRSRYADATAGRTAKWVKSFFRAAHRARLIPENPFAELKKLGSQTNKERQFFVTRETAQQILDTCPDTEWRLIFALSRFGGLRCPSEHLALTWADVNWELGRIRVKSPKTEHFAGKAERWVPMFPELRPHLEAAFEQAESGTIYVINRYRDVTQNLRTQLLRIIRRAGVTPWPKLFQNLRASRETELAAEFPLHVICSWIGNTTSIAVAHYLQVTENDYRQAMTLYTGAKSGAVVVQNPVQSAAVNDCPERQGESQTVVKEELVQLLATAVDSWLSEQMGTEGLEPPTPTV